VAAYFLLRTCESSVDLRLLVIGCDLGACKTPYGALHILVWSRKEKNERRVVDCIGVTKAVGKLLCPRVRDLYTEYVLVHMPILVANLGVHAKQT